MTDDASRLADRLTDLGYAALLGESPDLRSIESIRAEPEIGPRLAGIVDNRTRSWQARFLASEFLFRYVDMTLQDRCDHASLAESYFEALRHNYTGNGVDWGFGRSADDLGVLGRMVASWGAEGAGAFEAGLDDDSPVRTSFFWREPPHARPPYRVKDFAALVVAEAKGLEIDLAGPPGDRDRAISELKRTLGRPAAR